MLLILQFYPATRYFSSLKAKYSPQHSVPHYSQISHPFRDPGKNERTMENLNQVGHWAEIQIGDLPNRKEL
jgi:hypothetical protein